MSDTIYQEIILDHYKNPHNQGEFPDYAEKVNVSNPLCGDKIVLQVIFENEVVKDIKFKGAGCAISIASASILTDSLKGKTKSEILKMDKNTILELLGIQLTPNRLKCALLSLEAAQTACK